MKVEGGVESVRLMGKQKGGRCNFCVRWYSIGGETEGRERKE